MDLGFGNSNQVLGDLTAKALLQSTQAQEVAIDEELRRYDSLLESSDDALEQLREKRLQQMKNAQQQRQRWKDQGHGVYDELAQGQGDVAKAFFEAAKASERMVVHFYRPATRICDTFHAHLSKLAPQHMETRFVKINVENCESGGGGASFLVERLGVVVLPTLVIIKDRKAIHHLHGFDELGGSEDFSTKALAHVLGEHSALTRRDDEVPDELVSPRGVNSIRIHSTSRPLRDGIHDDEYDEDDD